MMVCKNSVGPILSVFFLFFVKEDVFAFYKMSI